VQSTEKVMRLIDVGARQKQSIVVEAGCIARRPC
jgi:hypothetical protein